MRSRVEIKTKTFLLNVDVFLYFFCREILNNSWWRLRFSRSVLASAVKLS
jgi:hypothetical protein